MQTYGPICNVYKYIAFTDPIKEPGFHYFEKKFIDIKIIGKVLLYQILHMLLYQICTLYYERIIHKMSGNVQKTITT